jgi:hypothetical protein
MLDSSVAYLIIKAALSGVLIATASEVSRRFPGWGALIVSLPLVSILAMIWLWRDTHDPIRMAAYVEATFWYILPTLPMFILIPMMLRHGYSFWSALGLGCALTVGLYVGVTVIGPRWGLRL